MPFAMTNKYERWNHIVHKYGKWVLVLLLRTYACVCMCVMSRFKASQLKCDWWRHLCMWLLVSSENVFIWKYINISVGHYKLFVRQGSRGWIRWGTESCWSIFFKGFVLKVSVPPKIALFSTFPVVIGKIQFRFDRRNDCKIRKKR